MNEYILLALTCMLVPMALLGWLGWYLGVTFGNKYPKYRWLRWMGLGLGILFGPIVGIMLSSTLGPCGFIGC